MNDKFVYKCVILKNGKFISYYATGKAQIIYRINKWSYPKKWLREKKFGILCFDNIENAVHFLNGEFSKEKSQRSVILECIPGNLLELPKRCSLDDLSWGIIREYDFRFPDKTIALDKIKPIRIAWYIDGNWNDFLCRRIEPATDKINYVNENKGDLT